MAEWSVVSREGQKENWVWWGRNGAWSRKASPRRGRVSRVLRGTRVCHGLGSAGRVRLGADAASSYLEFKGMRGTWGEVRLEAGVSAPCG